MEDELDAIARGETRGRAVAARLLLRSSRTTTTAAARSCGWVSTPWSPPAKTSSPREASRITIGQTPEGERVAVRVGRYGPYVQIGDDEPTGLGPRRHAARRADPRARPRNGRQGRRGRHGRSATTPRPASPSTSKRAASVPMSSSATAKTAATNPRWPACGRA